MCVPSNHIICIYVRQVGSALASEPGGAAAVNPASLLLLSTTSKDTPITPGSGHTAGVTPGRNSITAGGNVSSVSSSAGRSGRGSVTTTGAAASSECHLQNPYIHIYIYSTLFVHFIYYVALPCSHIVADRA